MTEHDYSTQSANIQHGEQYNIKLTRTQDGWEMDIEGRIFGTYRTPAAAMEALPGLITYLNRHQQCKPSTPSVRGGGEGEGVP